VVLSDRRRRSRTPDMPKHPAFHLAGELLPARRLKICVRDVLVEGAQVLVPDLSAGDPSGQAPVREPREALDKLLRERLLQSGSRRVCQFMKAFLHSRQSKAARVRHLARKKPFGRFDARVSVCFFD
jgi:hypothetical protein